MRVTQVAYKGSDKERAYQVAYRAAHRDKIAAYRAAHKAEKKAWSAANYQAHREQERAKVRAYQAAHKEQKRDYDRAYHQARPEAERERAHKRRLRFQSHFVERVYTSVVYRRDSGTCHICGKHVPLPVASLDHLVPLSHGGEHSYANVRLSHRRCNFSRGNRGPAQLLMPLPP